MQLKQFHAATWFAISRCGRENGELYEQWNAQALRALERLKAHDAVYAHGVSGLSRGHRIHAEALLLQGDPDRARRELEEDLAFVRSKALAPSVLPEIVLSEALTLAALGRWSGEFAPLRSPIGSLPAYVSFDGVEGDLAELTARRIGSSTHRLSSYPRSSLRTFRTKHGWIV